MSDRTTASSMGAVLHRLNDQETLGGYGKVALCQPAAQGAGESAAVVHAWHLVLAAELAARPHPLREAVTAHAVDLRGQKSQVASAMSTVVLVEPAQEGVQLAGKAAQVNRQVGELDEIAVPPWLPRRLGEERADVK